MNDLRQYLIDEFVEDFEEGRLTRREALRLLAGLTGVTLAGTLLDARAQQAAPAASAPARATPQVAPDDPAIVAGPVTMAGAIMVYLARPARAGRFPIVLVCHENRGLTAHIEDVTRRLAKAGFVGVAVDLLSREGGTRKLDPNEVPGLLGKHPPTQPVADFQAAMEYAQAQPFARADRVGMIGFCYGGGVTWRVAVATPGLAAAVPFYGLPAAAADVPKLHARVLAIYAGRDQRINANIPAIEAAMQEHHKPFAKIVYPDVDHAFHNDTSDRYNAAAAHAAWDEAIAFLRKNLG